MFAVFVCVSAYVLPVALRAFVHVLYVSIVFVCVRVFSKIAGVYIVAGEYMLRL